MALVPDYQVAGEPKASLLRGYNFRDTLGSEVRGVCLGDHGEF